MITAIREVRRARGMTLDDVARACVPATTPQQIGRLETGTRTVSLPWLERIAAALGVTAADLVRLPEREDLPVVACLDAAGVQAPRSPATAAPPRPGPGWLAITVAAGVGDYRAGDAIWCEPLAPAAYPSALNRDVLAPRPGGRFTFGRLLSLDAAEGRLHILPPGAGTRQQVIAAPPWLARAVRLVRMV